MSTARVHTVMKSRKDQGTCGNCGAPLPAGTGYRWFTVGFRSNYKYKRCLKSECFPRPSVLESSKAATIYAAQESFEDSIDSLTTVDEIQDAVQEVADAVREVADEYREALDAWEYGNYELEEKADHYDDQHSNIDGWTYDGNDEPERCEEHADDPDDLELGDDDRPLSCEECGDLWDQWIEEVRSAAQDVVNEIEVL